MPEAPVKDTTASQSHHEGRSALVEKAHEKEQLGSRPVATAKETEWTIE